jgi:hypothetical protein
MRALVGADLSAAMSHERTPGGLSVTCYQLAASTSRNSRRGLPDHAPWRPARPAGVPGYPGRLPGPQHVRRELREARGAGDPSWVTSHTFRKTAATILDEAALSAQLIADQLGHARPSMTQDVYLARRAVGDAAQALHAALTPDAPERCKAWHRPKKESGQRLCTPLTWWFVRHEGLEPPTR